MVKRRICDAFFPVKKRRLSSSFNCYVENINSNKKRLFIEYEQVSKKRAKLMEEPSDIQLLVNDFKEQEHSNVKKKEIYISSAYWGMAIFSRDPSETAATDIQRIFRGWRLRKQHIRCFNTIL